MRFFLVGRDRLSGAVRIVSEQPLASRQEAIDSLASLAPGVDELTPSDYFVVDLESVTPVVLYRAPGPAPAVDEMEPIADAWETPGGKASALLAPVDDAPPDTATFSSEDDLASALRRAATSMEAEGVIPAATVEDVLAAESEGATGEAATNDVLAAELDALASIAAVTMTTDASEDEDAEAVVTAPEEELVAAEAAPWPWEPEPADEPTSPPSADSVAAAADEPEAALAQDADASEASVQDDVSPAAPASILDEETPREPRDVLSSLSLLPAVPDEASAEAGSGTGEAEGLTITRGDDLPLLEDLTAGPFTSRVAEAPRDSAGAQSGGSVVPVPAVAAWDEPFPGGPDVKDAAGEPVDDLLATPPDEAEAESEPMIYEPQAIDMDSYACEDCVYVSTCPKAGQDSPASCGSFQWKSV